MSKVTADMTITLDGYASGRGRAGGPRVLNQYLAAGLVDELRLHVSPFVAGDGERIFAGTPGVELKPVSSRTTPHVTRLVYGR